MGLGDAHGRAENDGGHGLRLRAVQSARISLSMANTPAAEPTSSQLSIELADSILTAIKRVGDRVEEVALTVRGHGDELAVLRRSVHGSEPPKGGVSPTLPGVARQASEASLDVVALKMELADVRRELVKQSESMGIGVRGFQWLVSKDGRRSVARLVTLIATSYAALHAAGVIRW